MLSAAPAAFGATSTAGSLFGATAATTTASSMFGSQPTAFGRQQMTVQPTAVQAPAFSEWGEGEWGGGREGSTNRLKIVLGTLLVLCNVVSCV